MDVKYKRGLKIRLDDGTLIAVVSNQRRYQVEGYYGADYGNKQLEMFYSPWYAGLKGVANYLSKNFDINLIY